MRVLRSHNPYTKLFAPLLILITSSVSYGLGEVNYLQFNGRKVHPQNIIAKLKSPGQASQQTLRAKSLNSTVINRSELVRGLLILSSSDDSYLVSSSLSPVQMLKYRIEELKATGLFEYVQPDSVVRASEGVPSDEAYVTGKLWGLKNTGAGGGVAGNDINAEGAWAITTGSKKVVVAVVDTGVRYTHNDLKAQMWINEREIAGNKIDDDNNGYIDDIYGMNSVDGSGDPMDTEGHGTHVAGTIGAAANDGNQHVGVVWNVSIMACKFLGQGGEGTIAGALKAMEYAGKNGATIINASWGGSEKDQALGEAIIALGEKGVLFVAAAGNDGANNDSTDSYPANFDAPNLISVAALTKKNVLAGFSNYGAGKVHIAAPGEGIWSSFSNSDSAYRELSGTSMATPHVVGAAALVLAKHPKIIITSLRNRIIASATPVAVLSTKVSSKGRLNAHGALTIQPDGVLEVSVMPSSGSELKAGSSVTVQVMVSDIDMVKSARVEAQMGGQVLVLLDNGVAPDQSENDGIYTATATVPNDAEKLSYELTVEVAGKTSYRQTVEYVVIKPLANDNFANALVLNSAAIVQAHANNKTATLEEGEPSISNMTGGASVWWRWTAPAAGKVEINTARSKFDTLLGVYTGNSVTALELIAENDDSSYAVTSKLSFVARAGVEYHIVVDGYMGAHGNIILNIKPATDTGLED